MWNWCKKYKAIVAIIIVFCVMLVCLIVDSINYRKELNSYDEVDTTYVDTAYVIDSITDTLETIEIDSTSELIDSDAVD